MPSQKSRGKSFYNILKHLTVQKEPHLGFLSTTSSSTVCSQLQIAHSTFQKSHMTSRYPHACTVNYRYLIIIFVSDKITLILPTDLWCAGVMALSTSTHLLHVMTESL